MSGSSSSGVKAAAPSVLMSFDMSVECVCVWEGGDKSSCFPRSGISLSAFVTMCVTHQRQVAALHGDT